MDIRVAIYAFYSLVTVLRWSWFGIDVSCDYRSTVCIDCPAVPIETKEPSVTHKEGRKVSGTIRRTSPVVARGCATCHRIMPARTHNHSQ